MSSECKWCTLGVIWGPRAFRVSPGSGETGSWNGTRPPTRKLWLCRVNGESMAISEKACRVSRTGCVCQSHGFLPCIRAPRSGTSRAERHLSLMPAASWKFSFTTATALLSDSFSSCSKIKLNNLRPSCDWNTCWRGSFRHEILWIHQT